MVSKVTMKEPLQLAQQFAPHSPRVNTDIRHGIPKAVHQDPAVAAARVSKSGAGSLAESLMGFGKQAIKTLGKDTAEWSQQKVAEIAEKQKMSPEEFGAYGDASKLPHQWNPVFMKLYNRDVGSNMARDHFNAAYSEEMEREDAMGLTEEEIHGRILENVKNRAGKAGLNPEDPTQMLAFSSALNPQIMKGMAGFVSQKSKLMGKVARENRIADTVTQISALDVADPAAFKVALQEISGINEASLGTAEGREVLMKAVGKLTEDGNEERLKLMKDFNVGGKTLGELHGSWDNVLFQASTNNVRLGKEAESNFERGLFDRFQKLESFAEFKQFLQDSTPTARRNNIPEWEAAFQSKWEDAQVQRSNDVLKSSVAGWTSNTAEQLYNKLRGGETFEWLNEYDSGYSDTKGSPVFVNRADMVKAVDARFNADATAALGNPQLNEKQKAGIVAGLVSKSKYLPSSTLQANVVNMQLNQVSAVLNNEEDLVKLQRGELPPSFAMGLELLGALRKADPDSVPKGMSDAMNEIFSLTDTAGVSSVEATQLYAKAKLNKTPVDVKAVNKLKGTLTDFNYSTIQTSNLGSAATTMLRAGMTPDMIKTKLESGYKALYHQPLNGSDVGGIPRTKTPSMGGREEFYQDTLRIYATSQAVTQLANRGIEGVNPKAVKLQYGDNHVTVSYLGNESVATLSYEQIEKNFQEVDKVRGEKVRAQAEADKKREDGRKGAKSIAGALTRQADEANAGKKVRAKKHDEVMSKHKTPVLDIPNLAPVNSNIQNPRKF